MASTVINTRADLNAIAGTPEHTAFMAALAGSLWHLKKDDALKAWIVEENNAIIERFGFVRADFASAIPPAAPVYDEAAEINRLAAIAQAEADAEAKIAAKADTVVQYLRDHTPAEVDAYILSAVADLPPSARQMFRKMGLMLCVLSKQSLR